MDSHVSAGCRMGFSLPNWDGTGAVEEQMACAVTGMH